MDTGTIVGIIGAVFGAVSIVIAIYVYLRTKRRRELTWSVEHNIIIEGSKSDIPGLKIMFEDKEIPYMKSSLLTITNTGNEDLGKGDLSRETARFTLGIERENLLNVRLFDEDQEKEDNRYSAKEMAGKVAFSFDFMAKKDYARIQVLHTAANNPAVSSIDERFIKNGKLISEESKEKKRSRLSLVFIVLGFLLASATIVGVYVLVHIDAPPSLIMADIVAGSVLGGLSLSFGITNSFLVKKLISPERAKRS